MRHVPLRRIMAMTDEGNNKRGRLTRRIALALLSLGVFVGTAGGIVWAFDWTPHLPDWMVRVALIKLGFVAAGGLLAAGALLGRRARQAIHAQSSLDATDGLASLSEGPAREVQIRRNAETVARPASSIEAKQPF